MNTVVTSQPITLHGRLEYQFRKLAVDAQADQAFARIVEQSSVFLGLENHSPRSRRRTRRSRVVSPRCSRSLIASPKPSVLMRVVNAGARTAAISRSGSVLLKLAISAVRSALHHGQMCPAWAIVQRWSTVTSGNRVRFSRIRNARSMRIAQLPAGCTSRSIAMGTSAALRSVPRTVLCRR